MSAEHEQHRLGDFGSYFLGLPDRLARLEGEARECQETIRGLRALRGVLDRDALSRGALTGDPRLDAAICLSISGRSENWIGASVRVYRKIAEVEEELKDWEGGLVLCDVTSGISPYCGEIILGRVSEPRLFVEFRNPGAGELERAVTVGIRTYKHINCFNAGATVIVPKHTDGTLDITALFDPYWGGDTDLRYQANGPSAREGVAGLFLGRAKIKRHLHDVRQRLSLGTDAREAVGFIDRIERRLADLVLPEPP